MPFPSNQIQSPLCGFNFIAFLITGVLKEKDILYP
jgi:hypothetical protein